MNSLRRFSQRGQATLLIVTAIVLVGTVLLFSSLDVFVRDYNQKSKDFNQVLLDETTSSTFAVLETALERRMWEPPPDSNCMRSEEVEVSGSTDDGVNWNVKAKFNFATKNYEMTATGSYRNLTSTFKKKIKVMDASDYLLLSTNPNDISLERLYSASAPTALIARDRRIYTQGSLVMSANIDRDNPKMNFNGTPASWPGEYGTIIQGDRMQFSGGIRYQDYSIPEPNPDASNNIVSLLAPYSTPLNEGPEYYSQWGAGVGVFTTDYSKATTLQSMVNSSASGPLSKSDVASGVYPYALFGGTPPLKAWSAADSGTYLNDPDRQSIFLYGWGGANGFGVRIDATCISKSDWKTTKKFCSHSEHFPNGFKKWRSDAGLDGYLFTSDAVAIPAPTLSWDNLKALEADAQQCGAVVSAPVSPYRDCQVWDTNFVKSYANTGSTANCMSVSTLDLDTLALNNFNSALLNDPANSERLLRRVVYLKVPAEIKQKDAAGLMLSQLPADAARQKLSVWVVSEDMISLKGYQADTSSPLDSDPARLREVFFNEDASGGNKQPIQITLLTTEQVHLLSPFYVPMTPAHLTSVWPVSGGKIHPVRGNLTDYERYEDDGFKYGYRRFKISGMSLITNSATSSSNPFFFRGLWSGPDSSAGQFPSNLCMISKAGVDLQSNGLNPLVHSALIPAYAGEPNSPAPPASSRYYNGSTSFPFIYAPAVFNLQRAQPVHTGREQSEIVFKGISLSTTFATETPSGFRPLNTPLYRSSDGRDGTLPFDLSHKRFAYDVDYYYKQKPMGTACTPDNMEFITPTWSVTDPGASQPTINNGRQVFLQTSPEVTFRNVGSVLGVDQLVIETRGDIE
jgi:hypothetical protein